MNILRQIQIKIQIHCLNRHILSIVDHKAIKESTHCRQNNALIANVIFAAFCKVRYHLIPKWTTYVCLWYMNQISCIWKNIWTLFCVTKYFMRKKPNPQPGVDCVIKYWATCVILMARRQGPCKYVLRRNNNDVTRSNILIIYPSNWN